MIAYVLYALLIYLLYIVVHALLKLQSSKGEGNLVTVGLGPRDTVLEKSVSSQRCARAQRNMEESLFFFLPVALLLLIADKADGIALTGALIFVVARLLYLPAYAYGVFGLRSLIWIVGAGGIVMMVMRLIG
ncbi:MAG: MAPEG family protein [Pseudomonadota bacterium]